jgi:hypothetical protein
VIYRNCKLLLIRRQKVEGRKQRGKLGESEQVGRTQKRGDAEI